MIFPFILMEFLFDITWWITLLYETIMMILIVITKAKWHKSLNNLENTEINKNNEKEKESQKGN